MSSRSKWQSQEPRAHVFNYRLHDTDFRWDQGGLQGKCWAASRCQVGELFVRKEEREGSPCPAVTSGAGAEGTLCQVAGDPDSVLCSHFLGVRNCKPFKFFEPQLWNEVNAGMCLKLEVWKLGPGWVCSQLTLCWSRHWAPLHVPSATSDFSSCCGGECRGSPEAPYPNDSPLKCGPWISPLFEKIF